MPLVNESDYRPPRWLRNPHLNTVYAAMLRRLEPVAYRRERIDTPDGDFLDLDWSQVGSDKLVIVLHGLEGSADRPYVRGMVRRFNLAGWDGLGMNFRSCSGEMNRRLRTYHMSETTDLDLVIRHAQKQGGYRRIGLVGFSLGGNVILKYLGREGQDGPVDAAVAFSVPCEIRTANVEIDRFRNTIYLRRFLSTLNAKMAFKARAFPDRAPRPDPPARSFREFDDRFTAPIHGFRDAVDYWTQSSSLVDLPRLSVPMLLVNARDDTFLSEACYPVDQARGHRYFHLEMPAWGGHVGFVTTGAQQVYWSEERAWRFLERGL